MNSIIKRKYSSTLYTLYELTKYLSKKRKIQLVILIFVMISSAVSELFTLATVLPFLSVITDPNLIWDSKIGELIVGFLNLNKPNDLLFPLTLIFLCAVCFSGIIRILTLWMNTKLSALIGNDISREIYKRTIFQGYQDFIKNSSDEIISTNTTQLNFVVFAINNFLLFLTNLLGTIFIILALFFINFKISLISIFLFLFIYLQISLNTKKILFRNSKFISEMGAFQIQKIQETVGSIRDIILQGNQEEFLNNYDKNDLKMRQKTSQNQFLSAFPRFILETATLMFVGFTAFLLTKENDSNYVVNLVPTLGSFALGAQRLLPSMQQVYGSWTRVRSFIGSLENVSLTLKNLKPTFINKTKSRIEIDNNIRLHNVSFGYKSDTEILDKINLTVKKGERIGIIGESGSGKSTFLDLLMGLIKPTEGTIFIDNKNLYGEEFKNIYQLWMNSIAHVPQNVYLLDKSIKENIVFSFKSNYQIRDIEEVARKANILNFVRSLEKKFDSLVGERGVRISGGQKQRIGIARALLKNPKVLILDEATSSLDNKTEKKIIKEIEALDKNLTIIMVAYRISTLKNCDKIYKVQDKKIIPYKI